jgi:hypothetical protein
VQRPAIFAFPKPLPPRCPNLQHLEPPSVVLPRGFRRAVSQHSHASSVASQPIKGSAQLLRYRATLSRTSIRRAAVAQTAAIDSTSSQLPFYPGRIIKSVTRCHKPYQSEIAIACIKTTSPAERHHGALPSEKAEPPCSTWGLSGVYA